MTEMRAVDWANSVAPSPEDPAPASASEMTVEHLGSSATQADLEEFRGWVENAMAMYGVDEQTATDLIWNHGDCVNGAIRAGVA